MIKRIYNFVKPKCCPICFKPYKIDVFGKCVYCGALIGIIKW